ncbi:MULTISPECIES: lysophospholipid acyltransferase family protein [Exiguobacterium]|uniref:1-acyl-sn-glycerol-3-phosphate acyltransferase n=1 Tax=Exiguobacterium alkaliphilum TaxID=1428684 RepID=A0ABT2KUC6_9BACL|nr:MULTISPECIES: lysophospholipid acyltransferase family protein [Exiguobacterium]MCT4793963.1 1-acyl-sn-glycerol-3-phosphate acyltransferase [Exiguobacterium alkaliphilum]
MKPLNNGPFGMYRVARAAVALIQKLMFRVEYIGRDNVPADGSVLVCSNHQSNWDPVLLAIAIPKQRPLRFFAKKELFGVPVLKHILNRAGQIPVSRGEGDRQALRVVLQKLKENELISIFPEGTRSKDGTLGTAQAGVGFFALRSEAAVLPIAIIGRYKFRTKLKVVIGEPLDLTALKANKASAQEAADLIMERISELYIEHSRNVR